MCKISFFRRAWLPEGEIDFLLNKVLPYFQVNFHVENPITRFHLENKKKKSKKIPWDLLFICSGSDLNQNKNRIQTCIVLIKQSINHEKEKYCKIKLILFNKEKLSFKSFNFCYAWLDCSLDSGEYSTDNHSCLTSFNSLSRSFQTI